MTPEWLAAISTTAGALIAAITVFFAAYLLRKQAASLDATTKALRDEMKWRRRNRVSTIRLKPLAKGKPNEDLAKLRTFFSRSGMDATWKFCHVEVTNDSDHRIKSVTMKPVDGEPPRCHIVDFEDRAGHGTVNVLPPGASVRFYWSKEEIRQELVEIEFTDEEDGRWRLHHRDGLFDVVEQE